MKKALRSIIAFSIAPIYALTVWGEFGNVWGIMGGWLAALAIIGPLWFILHFSGVIPQEADASFVDIGLAIGVGGIAQGVFSGLGLEGLVDALPTIIVMILGAIAGGVAAAKISMAMKEEE